MKIIDNRNSIQNAARVLKKGGILIFPTDTVYGIGCLLTEKAIRRLYKIKNRPLSQPTAILISNKNIPKICSSTNKGDDFISGQITLILSVAMLGFNIPKIILKNGKIGVRIPNHPWLQRLIDLAGPIVTSSANKKGENPPAKFTEIDQDIIEKADLIIKTDEKLPGIPSRVYDLELKKYLR